MLSCHSIGYPCRLTYIIDINFMSYRMMRSFFIFLFTFVLFGQSTRCGAQEIITPNERQLKWQEAELGAIFHYDLHVFDGKKYNQARNRLVPVPDIQIFNPSQLGVEQWVLSAKAMGAKFALITATHETGFALFPSQYNPYNVSQLNFKEGKADLVKDFVDACRKHGIKPGVYLGIRWNSFFGVHDFVVDGTGEFQLGRQQYYNKMVEGMVQEICTNYGELFEIWFDGGASSPAKGAPDVLPIVKKLQPNCLFYHNDELAEARWGGSESGTVGYPNWSTFTFHYTGSGESAPAAIAANHYQLLKQGDREGKYFMPAMADAPLRGAQGRHEWFWEPGDEHTIYPLQDLLNMYYKSVGRNATLILGITPDTSGLVPKGDFDRLKAFGDAVNKRFSTPLARTHGTEKIIHITLPKIQHVNQLVIQEDIKYGHRVLSFVVEAKIGSGWKVIDQGTAIGNKYMKLLAEPVHAKSFRLRLVETKATPFIKDFSIYDVN